MSSGQVLPLMLKHFGSVARLAAARHVRPAALEDPKREIYVYEEILAQTELPTAHLYAADAASDSGRAWLVLERVDGPVLGHCGDFSSWSYAAETLGYSHAVMHARRDLSSRLLSYGIDYQRMWLSRARSMAERRIGPSRQAGLDLIEQIADPHERAVGMISELPCTIVHGDCNASNIVVQPTGARPRVCLLDWEVAGIGPGVLDFAALTSGDWSDDERCLLARSYLRGLGVKGDAPDLLTFLEMLDAAYLLISVQWLGWSDDWSPPAWHRQDWGCDALRFARRVTTEA